MIGSLCRLETRFRIKPFPGGRIQLLKKWLLIVIFYGCVQDCIFLGGCFTNLDLTWPTFTATGHTLWLTTSKLAATLDRIK